MARLSLRWNKFMIYLQVFKPSQTQYRDFFSDVVTTIPYMLPQSKVLLNHLDLCIDHQVNLLPPISTVLGFK
jgi:hypothetical protein